MRSRHPCIAGIVDNTLHGAPSSLHGDHSHQYASTFGGCDGRCAREPGTIRQHRLLHLSDRGLRGTAKQQTDDYRFHAHLPSRHSEQLKLSVQPGKRRLIDKEVLWCMTTFLMNE